MQLEHEFTFDWKTLIPTAHHLCPLAALSEPVMAQTWQSKGGRVSPASDTLMSSHRPLICHTYRWHLLHEWAARIETDPSVIKKDKENNSIKTIAKSKENSHLNELVRMRAKLWHPVVNFIGFHYIVLLITQIFYVWCFIFWHVLALKQPMNSMCLSLSPHYLSLSLHISLKYPSLSATTMSSLSPWSNFSLLWL